MIVVKNSELTQTTIEVINKILDKDLKAKPAFQLMRIIKDLSPLLEDKTKLEKKIYEKYVIRDEDGQVIVPLDEHGNKIENAVKINDVNSFNKEMTELYEIETTLNHEKLNFDTLEIDTIKPKDLLLLDFLFI